MKNLNMSFRNLESVNAWPDKLSPSLRRLVNSFVSSFVSKGLKESHF